MNILIYLEPRAAPSLLTIKSAKLRLEVRVGVRLRFNMRCEFIV